MQLLANTLIAGSFAALMAGGLSLVYGVLGVFNMALGQLALVCGYTTWWFFMRVGWSFPLAAIAGLFVCAVTTLLAFEIFVGLYYKRHRFLPLVTTIALGMILDGAIIMIFREEPKSIRLGGEIVHLGGAIFTMEQVVLIVLTIVFLLVLAWVIVATPFGRKVRATVQHSSAAESLGINSAFLHRALFVFSGVLAGLAGIYQGIDQNLTPVLAFPITIKAYAALIAGGKNSLWGTIFFAYVIALFEQLAIGIPWLGFYIPAGYQSTVALVVIIVILLIRPQGIFGTRVRTA